MHKKLFWIFAIALLGTSLFLFFFQSTSDHGAPPPVSLQLEQNSDNHDQPSPLALHDAIGQLFIIGFYGVEMTDELRSLLQTFRPGGVLLLGRNITNAEQLRRLTTDLQQVAQNTNGIPLFIAIDQEGGIVSRIRWTDVPEAPVVLRDSAHAREIGHSRGKELRSLGITMNLAPVLDSWHRGDFLFSRSFQKNDAGVASRAVALIRGLQDEQVIAVPKHFPGYDGITFNPEMTVIPRVTTMPNRTLFQNVIQETRAPFVMLSHVIYDDRDRDLPFPFSKTGIDLLRKELGDDILIMSDDLLSAAFQEAYALHDIASRGLESGLEIFLAGDPTLAPKLMDEVQNIVRNDQTMAENIRLTARKIINRKKIFFKYNTR